MLIALVEQVKGGVTCLRHNFVPLDHIKYLLIHEALLWRAAAIAGICPLDDLLFKAAPLTELLTTLLLTVHIFIVLDVLLLPFIGIL